MIDLNLNTLTPGIRKTVEWLRANRFETTDSGDGKTNMEAGMEGAMGFPNVTIRLAYAELLVVECRRLRYLLKTRNIELRAQGMDVWVPACQGTYDPADGSAIILLTGVDDDLLEGRRKVG